MLASGPTAARERFVQITRIDLDLVLLGLGQHCDRDGARVDPAAFLVRRGPLPAVSAAFMGECFRGSLTTRTEQQEPWPGV